MKHAFQIPSLLALWCCLIQPCEAQINAITADGRKVILNDDGTWKYVFEDDGKKVILNADGTWRYATGRDSSVAVSSYHIPDSSHQALVDSVKKIVPKPVKVKPPLNLACSALIDVEREISGDKYVAVAKDILVATDSTAGFTISFYKTKNGPLYGPSR